MRSAVGAFRTSSGGPRNEEDDNNNNKKEEEEEEEEEFLLATGSSNGEVFVWAVSKTQKERSVVERVLAKFNANAAQSKGSMRENNDDDDEDDKDDAEDKEDNEVYGLTFLGCKDEYLIIATDAELIGVEVVTARAKMARFR